MYCRYSDLYFNEEEYIQAVSDLANSKVFDELLIHGDVHDIPVAGGIGGNDVEGVGGHSDPPPGVIQPGQVGQALPQPDDSVARRRYLMMDYFNN